jgi:hypothetical protein
MVLSIYLNPGYTVQESQANIYYLIESCFALENFTQMLIAMKQNEAIRDKYLSTSGVANSKELFDFV